MGRSLLEASAQEGARLVALSYLDQAASAASRLSDSKDGESLHDFRVGMRRLRACLRAYRDVLGDAIGKKARKRVGAVASRTNAGRDAEVQLEWVRRLAGDADEEQPGIDWIATRLETQKDEVYEKARAEGVERFRKVESRLREQLTHYAVEHIVGEPPDESRFGDVAAAAMSAQLDDLLGDLKAVGGVEDEALAHDARIHGKRLRYLLEPFREERPGAKAVVKELKALQDLLGDLNDLHNLARTLGDALERTAVERARRLRDAASDGDPGAAFEEALAGDERPGLLGLLKRVQRDRGALLDALLNEWLADGGRLDRLAEDLSSQIAAMGGPPARDDVEIERKYLLRALPPRCQGLAGVDIDQGYLPGERLVERVRRKRMPDGTEKYVRTVKHGEGVARLELEEECGREMFSTLWSLTKGRRVRKRRYTIDAKDGLAWEIDEFKDRELFLAELEIPAEDTEVDFPDWLAPYVEREVTEDPAYLNLNLAR